MNQIDKFLERTGNQRFFWLANRASVVSIQYDQLWHGKLCHRFFIVPMGNELRISRTQFSTIPLFKLTALPILLFLEIMVDRKQWLRCHFCCLRSLLFYPD